MRFFGRTEMHTSREPYKYILNYFPFRILFKEPSSDSAFPLFKSHG